MVRGFARVFVFGWVVVTLATPTALRANVPDYKLGDTAQEDIITPVALEVVNPDATDALKRREADKVPMTFRFNTRSADEAEDALREAFASARTNFIDALRRVMKGRTEDGQNAGSSLFDRAVESARRHMNGFPLLDDLAPVWSRNGSDEETQAVLVGLLRETLKSPVIAQKEETFQAQDSAWLIPVDSLTDKPSPENAEQRGRIVRGDQMLLLSQARNHVRTNLPAKLAIASPYLALFVRPNAQPDADLTGLIRARRTASLAAIDSYAAAQVVARRGQVIDRKVLVALAALREKTVIGTLQQKLESEQVVSAENRHIAAWTLAGCAFILVVLTATLWRMRSRRQLDSLLPVPAHAGLPEMISDEPWRSRALAAEAKAERAHEALRSGMLHWMRERIVQGLFHQRTELLTAQQRAEMEMRALEQRLEQLHTPLQERIAAYEQRIAELERELVAKGEENRELIKARITLARHQLDVERNRTDVFGTN